LLTVGSLYLPHDQFLHLNLPQIALTLPQDHLLLTGGFIKSYGMLTVSSYHKVYNIFVLQHNITSFECVSHGSTEMIEIAKMSIFECEHGIIGPFLSNYFGSWGNIATLPHHLVSNLNQYPL
jgi:hypothetical protein